MSDLNAHMVDTDKELYDLWPSIRDGLLAITGKCHGIKYRPEDVYHEIKKGSAKLFVITDGNAYEGFFTCRTENHPDGGILYIWHLYRKGHSPGFFDWLHEYVKGLRRILGCQRFYFGSSRPGWNRIARMKGREPSYTAYFYED
jgi:hypothetical protein